MALAANSLRLCEFNRLNKNGLFGRDCPPALETLIGRMLQKDVRQRAQTMEEVLFELEPLRRNMHEADLSELIASGEQFIRSNDFFRARDVLRNALQINGANERAKTLLEQVNSELKKSQTHPQILDVPDCGRNFLKEGRIQDAVAAGEAALRVDSSFIPAKEFIAEVQSAADWSRRTQGGENSPFEIPSAGELTQTTEMIEKVPSPKAPRSLGGPLPADSAGSQPFGKTRSPDPELNERDVPLFRSGYLRTAGAFRQRPVPFALGALLVVLGLSGLMFWIWVSPSQKQIALRDQRSMDSREMSLLRSGPEPSRQHPKQLIECLRSWPG